MKNLFSMLLGALANIDKAHDRITAAYNLWGTIYGFLLQLRGVVPAVPAPVAAPAPVAPVVPVPVPAPAPLPDAAYTPAEVAVDEEQRQGDEL